MTERPATAAEPGRNGRALSARPLVSIVIPCRNEVGYIGRCLASIVANDYGMRAIEVLVADGMSDDGTREVIAEWSSRYPSIRLVDNPDRITPFAMNAGVRAARGELIMIMSAHATYQSDAIRLSVEYSASTRADNVGGSWRIVPRDEGLVARSIVYGLSHKFGVGGATYRTGGANEPMWVDTAAYGCYRREVFDRIGLFNERLVHGQDMELNLRLRRAGGRTLLVPEIVITYYARTSYMKFVRHNWRNGVWVVVPSLYSNVMAVAPRHLVPLVFVCSLIVPLLLALVWPPVAYVALLSFVAYLLAMMAAAVDLAVQRREWRLVGMMAAIFPSIHLTYGLGGLWALLFRIPRHYMSSKTVRAGIPRS